MYFLGRVVAYVHVLFIRYKLPEMRIEECSTLHSDLSFSFPHILQISFLRILVDFEEQRMFLEEEHKASSVNAIQNITTANSIEVERLNKQIQDLESALMLEKTKTEGKKNGIHFFVLRNTLHAAHSVTLIIALTLLEKVSYYDYLPQFIFFRFFF